MLRRHKTRLGITYTQEAEALSDLHEAASFLLIQLGHNGVGRVRNDGTEDAGYRQPTEQTISHKRVFNV